MVATKETVNVEDAQVAQQPQLQEETESIKDFNPYVHSVDCSFKIHLVLYTLLKVIATCIICLALLLDNNISSFRPTF